VPLYPNLRCFPEGRQFKQWTGDDSKALMKVYLPAIEGHVPPAMVRTFHAFLNFCYYARRNSLNESALESLQDALDCFQCDHCIFQESGVRDCGPKGFSLPRQHAMNHYHHLIQEFGAPNGLCSSITESKHIKAVKKPWQHSNHFKALGQMLVTNQCLDKLAAVRVDFETHHMLKGSILSASICALDCLSGDRGDHSQHHSGSTTGHASYDRGDDGTNTDDNEIQMHNDPHVLNYVCLAKTPGMSAIYFVRLLLD